MVALDDWPSSDAQSGERTHSEGVTFEAGTLIGGAYRVIERLGTGSMGVVFLANDERLDRRVAIKFTHSHLLSAAFRERFMTEARAMASVSHPNVVQIHAFGEHEGAPYFVMEHIQGCTLEQWLVNRSPIDLAVALRILGDLCRGLSAIHASHAVHHDIKPSNILLDENLRPRVADLGLAVFCRQDNPTERGGVIGTPTYMAPEIAFSKNQDPALRSRADVYSLACVAYELFAGHPPFDGTGNMGMILQHATKPVAPLSTLRPDLPAGLDEVLLTALAKDPQHRTPTVEAFRCNLVAACQMESEPLHVLVAEDDDDFRDALRMFLTFEFPNAEIECVQDGNGALQAVNRKTPSVAIIDLRMPRMDGMELTALLRARATNIAMPIIILTACGGAEEWQRLSALGADRFLLKPVILADLVALVRRVLAERRSIPPLSGRMARGAA